MHVQSPWKVHSDKRTEGRQISVFNIIDYQLDFTTKDDENSRVCFEKKNKTKQKTNKMKLIGEFLSVLFLKTFDVLT